MKGRWWNFGESRLAKLYSEPVGGIHFFGKKGIPPTGYSDNFLRDMEYLFSWKLYQVIFLDCDDNNRVKIKYSKKEDCQYVKFVDLINCKW